MKTILVVDDELANAEVLSLILSDEGYRVFTASNGRDGLEKLDAVNPDLIVLDLMMPVMDGSEMGRSVRANPRTRGIKLVMNSSLNEQSVRERFSDYDAFLRKPFGVDILLRVVREMLGEGPGTA